VPDLVQASASPDGQSEVIGRVPAWLLAPPAAAGLAQASQAHRARRAFSSRLLHTLAAWLERAMSADELARRRGLLQRLDPRVKLVTLMAFIVTAALAVRLSVLAVLLAVAVALVLSSRLGLRRFALRAWTFIPLFTALIMLPTLFGVVTHGPALVTFWSHGAPFWPLPHHLAITRTGLLVFARLLLRVTVIVSYGVLLTLTTPWADLLKAMRALGVPRGLAFVLAVAYRYVFTLVHLVQEMAVARTSRQVGPVSTSEDRRFLTGTVATLFGKSQAVSEQVYQAMISRGYTGEVRTLDTWQLRRLDVVWAIAVAAALTALLTAAPLLGAR
jgi:cobalt/nickel transport system permease protein